MDFEKVCMIFSMQEPYYGILLSSMEHIEDKSVGTLAMAHKGNVFKLYYNPEFWEKFNIDTQIELLRHEVIHAAFNHWCLWTENERKAATPEIRYLQKIAADLDVNCYINRDKLQKEAGGIFCEDIGFSKNLGAREYFRLLLNKYSQPQQQQAQNPQKPCNGCKGGQSIGQSKNQQGKSNGQNSNNGNQSSKDNPQEEKNEDGESRNGGQNQGGNGGRLPTEEELKKKLPQFDNHDKWPEMTEEEAEQLSQAIDDLLVFAAEECEKGRGTIPGELSGRINLLREKKKPKPVADWKRHFRRYLGNEFTEFIRKSKKRESRRFPDAAGNRHRRKSRILVAIDTSGSVSMPEYREFFGQLNTLIATTDFHVLECDTRIAYEYEFKGKPNDTLHGGGGTSFQPPVDYFNAHRREFEALVYFTDGYADIPENTPKNTLWVISSGGDQKDRKKYKVNGASVAFIPKKNN